MSTAARTRLRSYAGGIIRDAGATAREIILRHVFGRLPGRRTLDVDFGIAVRDWDHFETLKKALIEQASFVAHHRVVQRLVYRSTPAVLDLIPFGGVEDAARNIAWPPEEDIVMRVIGFSDALESAVLVRLDDDLTIPVVSIPALSLLKLLNSLHGSTESTKSAMLPIFSLC